MTTKGNLELRISHETLYASANADGDRAYEIVPGFLDFLDKHESPTIDQYKEWFRAAAKEILNDYSEKLIRGVPCEVIIDIPRKLVLHDASEERFTPELENACIVLEQKYNYQILKFVSSAVRDYEKEHAGKE